MGWAGVIAFGRTVHVVTCGEERFLPIVQILRVAVSAALSSVQRDGSSCLSWNRMSRCVGTGAAAKLHLHSAVFAKKSVMLQDGYEYLLVSHLSWSFICSRFVFGTHGFALALVDSGGCFGDSSATCKIRSILSVLHRAGV